MGEIDIFNSVAEETFAVLGVEMKEVFLSVQNEFSLSLVVKHKEIFPKGRFFSVFMQVIIGHMCRSENMYSYWILTIIY